jgi:myo-inositol-1-phosphate synthase
VATTAVTGLLALRAGLIAPIGCVTESEPFAGVGLPGWDQLVVGGHDVVHTPLDKRAEQLAESGLIPHRVLAAVAAGLRAVDANIRDGYHPATHTGAQSVAARRLAADLTDFRSRHGLERVVVVNVSSTEPPVPYLAEHDDLAALERALDDPTRTVLPPSSLTAYAALLAGCSYVDFTPSPGIRLPALHALAVSRGLPYAGSDGKTGETLLRTVLAPMFTARALKVRSWAGTNLLGGGDGANLADPTQAQGKLDSKARGLAALLGEGVTAPLHIDNVPDLGEQKTAWDHVSFEGFLGARMSLQLTWMGLDSALAAPLVLDLARLVATAHAVGKSGPLGELAFFFKDPVGSDEHRFAEQTRMLTEWAQTLHTATRTLPAPLETYGQEALGTEAPASTPPVQPSPPPYEPTQGLAPAPGEQAGPAQGLVPPPYEPVPTPAEEARELSANPPHHQPTEGSDTPPPYESPQVNAPTESYPQSANDPQPRSSTRLLSDPLGTLESGPPPGEGGGIPQYRP